MDIVILLNICISFMCFIDKVAGREKIKMYDEVFSNSSGNIVQKSKAKSSENRACIRPAAEPVDRPIDRCAQSRAGRPLG